MCFFVKSQVNYCRNARLKGTSKDKTSFAYLKDIYFDNKNVNI